MALTGLTKVQKVGINTATIPTVGGVEGVGVITATNFIGDGSGLTGVTGSGAGVIVRDGGSLVGTAGTINFGTNLNVSAISAGIVTVTNAASATALTNLSDVTISSPSNGQVLKYNGSAFVNAADANTTYSQSSVASGSNVNLRLTDSGGTNDDILITAGSNITFSSVSANGFTIAASGGGGGGGLSNVVEDTTPQLGGALDLNNKFITGSGGINVSGVVTATSFAGNITGNVTGNADTATTATNVTVSANNSTDETVYPIFVDGPTGAQGAESDTGLSYNPSSGNLTATKFTGSGVALTGVVTSIVAGSNISLAGGPTGIVTISSSGGGGLSLSNGTNNNVVTASSASALNGEGNLTFDGTTLVLTGNQTASESIVVGTGVTLNARGINAVGTAVTAGRFHADGGSFQAQIGIANQGFYLYSGNSTHLGISWSSSASINQFRGNSGGNHPLVIDDFSYISISPKSSGVNLYFAENLKLATTSGGINITGVATATEAFSGPLTGNVTGNADTATAATRVTLTNQAGDTTCNVLFAQSATGNQLPHTNANLTFNATSGALTAGSFVKSGGTSSQFLKADGSVDGSTYLTSGSYIENVVEDTTPQLGGNLDLNSKNITGTGNAQIVGVITATSAVKTWTLGASGTDHYTFIGDGFTSATNDPDIYLERGKRYAFLNNAGTNHPFWIKTTPGTGTGNPYNTGVTNNGAQSGYVTFNVPWDAPARLYYQCQAHGNMVGNIYIRGAGGGNDKVGVTTITGGLLHIKDNTSPAIRLQDNNNVNSDFKIYSPDGDNHLRIYHENTSTDLFTLTSAGKLLVGGQTSPRSAWFNQSNTFQPSIQVEGSGEPGGQYLSITANNNASGYGARFLIGRTRGTGAGATTVVNNGDELGGVSWFGSDGSEMVEAAHILSYVDAGTGSNTVPGSLRFATTANGAGSPTEALRIDSSGRVQIGSSTLAARNTFNGIGRLNIQNNSADGTVDFTQGIVFTDNASNEGAWTHAAIVTTGSTGYDGNLVFGTDGSDARDMSASSITEKMRLTADGCLLVGKSTVPQNSGGPDNTSSGTAAEFVYGHVNVGVEIRSTNGASNQKYLGFKYGGGPTDNGGIRRDGTSNNVEFYGGSDRRIKMNIQDMDNTLSKICQISLKKFDFKDGTGSGVGVIGQELINIFPEKVTKTDDGTGDTVPDGVEPWSVGHNYTYQILKAIQELKAENDSLKARIATLEGS